MKKSILTAMTLLMAGAGVQAQMTTQEKWDILSGTRIDFLNAQGERIYSSYPNSYNAWFSTYGNQEDGFSVNSTTGAPFSSMVMVPAGVNSYPLGLTSGTSDISYSYREITDTNGDGRIDYNDIDFSKINMPEAAKAPTRAEGDNELKSGTVILLTFDIPEGTYPRVTIYYNYTSVNPFENEIIPRYINLPFFYIVNSLAVPSFEYSWMFNSEDREKSMEWYDSNGNFYADPKVKNRWHYLIAMPNEPMNIELSGLRADGELLTSAVNTAATFVYRQIPTVNSGQLNFNAEPWFMAQAGEAMSQDDISTMWIASNEKFLSHEFFSNASYYLPYLAWRYYFGMIDMANFYLNNMSKFNDATASERNHAEAAFRVLRANSYLRLMQMFGPRWEDSSNGQTPVVPILTEWGNFNLAPSTMAEVRDFCKTDLEYAISHLEGSHFDAPAPDADVARGLLVRLSLLCHDWNTAASQAQVLVDKYPLTTNGDMKDGFFSPADSWIWTAPQTDSDGNDNLYYYSFQSSAAINGAYILGWNVGSKIGCIDRVLYKRIPENDMRRKMFVMPEILNYGGVERFYSSSNIDATTMKLTTMRDRTRKLIDRNKPEGVDLKLENVFGGDRIDFYFGSQFKFWGGRSGEYNPDDNVCLMRVDEMLLARAEALYELGDEAGARECIIRLNSMRNPDYTCSATGENLREEIRFTRRIELWGEGHNFFDFKRWNLPIVRNAWVADDINSGNWPAAVAATFAPSDHNGWRFLVPKPAVDANPNLDISVYRYTSVAGYENGSGQQSAPAVKSPAAPALKTFNKEMVPFSKVSPF